MSFLSGKIYLGNEEVNIAVDPEDIFDNYESSLSPGGINLSPNSFTIVANDTPDSGGAGHDLRVRGDAQFIEYIHPTFGANDIFLDYDGDQSNMPSSENYITKMFKASLKDNVDLGGNFTTPIIFEATISSDKSDCSPDNSGRNPSEDVTVVNDELDFMYSFIIDSPNAEDLLAKWQSIAGDTGLLQSNEGLDSGDSGNYGPEVFVSFTMDSISITHVTEQVKSGNNVFRKLVPLSTSKDLVFSVGDTPRCNVLFDMAFS